VRGSFLTIDARGRMVVATAEGTRRDAGDVFLLMMSPLFSNSQFAFMTIDESEFVFAPLGGLGEIA